MARSGLEIRGDASAPLDMPLTLGARGGADAGELLWRARVRDDDGRIWRAAAPAARELDLAWTPAKASSGDVAALASLRPLEVEVRVEAEDGRTATRTVRRVIVAEGVRLRRWKAPVAGTLCLPAGAPVAAAIVAPSELAAVAGALLAGRGVLAFALARGADPDAARTALAAVPGAADAGDAVETGPLVPPGAPAAGDAAARAEAWDALLERLGASVR